MLTVSVENFGPIREGTVKLRPLTTLVGPNNSGKSYMAMLIYAVARTLALDPTWDARWMRRPASLRFLRSAAASIDVSERALAALEGAEAREREEVLVWLAGRLALDRKRPVRAKAVDIDYAALPVPLQQALQIVVEDYLDSLAESLSGEIERCFGAKISDLSSSFAPDKSFTISIGSTQPRFSLRLRASGRKFVVASKSVDLSAVRYRASSRHYLRYFDVERDDSRSSLLLFEFLSESALQIMRKFVSKTYYLPAARSGILQSHKALASFVMHRSPLAGIESLDIPRLTGVITDFISSILTLDRDQETTDTIKEIAGFLESEVIHGNVSIRGGDRVNYPEIYYTRDGESFELHRTSSMVSELAPIILFIRHLTRPDDTLILEEPESHLHPASQVQLARGLARLLNGSVNLLLTTHSDYFLQQLSHLMQLGALSSEQRMKLGYSDDDVIPVSSVGAYLFDTSEPESGSVIRELSMKDSDGIPGIPDDQFADVSEVLYNEMVNLERAAARNESRIE